MRDLVSLRFYASLLLASATLIGLGPTTARADDPGYEVIIVIDLARAHTSTNCSTTKGSAGLYDDDPAYSNAHSAPKPATPRSPSVGPLNVHVTIPPGITQIQLPFPRPAARKSFLDIDLTQFTHASQMLALSRTIFDDSVHWKSTDHYGNDICSAEVQVYIPVNSSFAIAKGALGSLPIPSVSPDTCVQSNAMRCTIKLPLPHGQPDQSAKIARGKANAAAVEVLALWERLAVGGP